MGHSQHFNAAEFSGYTVYCGECAEGCGLYVLVVGCGLWGMVCLYCAVGFICAARHW